MISGRYVLAPTGGGRFPFDGYQRPADSISVLLALANKPMPQDRPVLVIPQDVPQGLPQSLPSATLALPTRQLTSSVHKVDDRTSQVRNPVGKGRGMVTTALGERLLPAQHEHFQSIPLGVMLALATDGALTGIHCHGPEDGLADQVVPGFIGPKWSRDQPRRTRQGGVQKNKEE